MGSMCEDGLSVVIEAIEKPHFDAALMEKAAMLEEDSDKQEKKIEEEVKDVSIPKLTPEEEKRQYEELMKKIQKIEQNKKTDN